MNLSTPEGYKKFEDTMTEYHKDLRKEFPSKNIPTFEESQESMFRGWKSIGLSNHLQEMGFFRGRV